MLSTLAEETPIAQSWTAERQFIRDIASGYKSPSGNFPYLVMMKAYLDESDHSNGEVCVIAGFIGAEEQWSAFVEDWKLALGQRQHLHMNDLRWKHPRTARSLARLGPIPDKHGLIRICGQVRHEDYRDLIKGRVSDEFAKPWMIAMQLCIIQTLRWLPANETVEFIFEQQEQFKPYVGYLHDAVFQIGKHDPRVISIHFIKKGATHCTEAADYLAFEICEHLRNPDSEKSRMGRSIVGDGQAIGAAYQREHMTDLVRDFYLKGG